MIFLFEDELTFESYWKPQKSGEKKNQSSLTAKTISIRRNADLKTMTDTC